MDAMPFAVHHRTFQLNFQNHGKRHIEMTSLCKIEVTLLYGLISAHPLEIPCRPNAPTIERRAGDVDQLTGASNGCDGPGSLDSFRGGIS
jgi:hypothetical protein